MPTPKDMDDTPMTGGSSDKVSTLQYIEARIRDAKENSAIEIQALREMLLRFRDDAAAARDDLGRCATTQLEEADRRYGQRFEAQNIALKEAALASEKAIQAAMVAAEKAINAALSSAEKAVAKAEAASESRFASVNEFRAQLSDQTATFIPRAEFLAQVNNINEKIDSLKTSRDASAGKTQGISTTWAVVIGAVGLVISIGTGIGFVTNFPKSDPAVNARFDDMVQRMDALSQRLNAVPPAPVK